MAWGGGFTATAIAEAVRSGSIAPTEPTREALRRITERDAAVGAFVVVRTERAIAEAESLARRPDLKTLPLAGVPVAIKDNIAVESEPMRNGSAATSAAPQPADHPVTARLRSAGAVVVGITAVPELCIWAATDSPTRITRNPWNPSRSSGGSGGGSGAAVAAGLVPVAHSADGMGSIRVPAAACGLVGLKPGSGVVPSGLGVDSWFGASENGALATTVGDLALVLSVLAGRPDLAKVPPAAPRRVALAVASPVVWLRTDRQWAAAAERIGALLQRLGYSVTPRRVYNPTIAPISRWTAGPAADAEGLDRALLEPRTRGHIRVGRVVQRLHPVRAEQVAPIERRVRRDLDGCDVVLTPTLAHPPGPAVVRSRRSWLSNLVTDVRFSPYTPLWNVLGWPAVSVPAGLHPRSRTPMAVQIAAPPGAESMLLGIAAEIEKHAPWEPVAPPPSAAF